MTTTLPARRSGALKTLDEIGVFIWRNLAHIPRVPERLLDVTVQPIMFVLLFGYIFGSAINVEGGNYREFLMAGIFIQTLAFGSMQTAVGVVNDFSEAVIDRFRALPISAASILIGRAIASLIEGLLGIVVMAACGLVVGWAPHGTPLETPAGLALMLFFSFSMISLGTLIGLMVRSVGTAQTFGFVLIFPLTFASNAFVPIDNMPWVVRLLTDWSPVTPVVAALRQLFHNPNPIPPDAAWPLLHPIEASLLWCTALTVIGLGLAIWRYSTRKG
jgi:ABC-type multidrug transport system permease subunit